MTKIEHILEQLHEHYHAAVTTLREDVIEYARSGAVPPQRKREDGSYAYPELRVHFSGEGAPSDRSRAFGRLEQQGTYATTITRPALFADYLTRPPA